MKVSAVASLVGVTPDTVRYYASIGLLAPAIDPDNGYRRFKDTDVHRLRFVLRAKRLGFDLDEIAEVLGIRVDAVKQRASRALRELEAHLKKTLTEKGETNLADAETEGMSNVRF